MSFFNESNEDLIWVTKVCLASNNTLIVSERCFECIDSRREWPDLKYLTISSQRYPLSDSTTTLGSEKVAWWLAGRYTQSSLETND